MNAVTISSAQPETTSLFLSKNFESSRVDIFKHLDLEDLQNCPLVCKAFYYTIHVKPLLKKPNENPLFCVSLWSQVAERVASFAKDFTLPNADRRRAVHDFVSELEKKVFFDFLPSDDVVSQKAKELVTSKKLPTFEELLFLEKYREAENDLTLWIQLSKSIGVASPVNTTGFESIDQWSSHAKELSGWVEKNKKLFRGGVLIIVDRFFLSSLPDSFPSLKLSGVHLSRNKFTSLPSSVFSTTLQILNFRHNGITSLSGEIGRCTNLRVLNLSDNRLPSIPPAIGRLTKLTTLDLGKNPFISLPSEIGQLESLVKLVLDEIPSLTSLPDTMGSLTNLTTLSIQKTPISQIPDSVKNLIPKLTIRY